LRCLVSLSAFPKSGVTYLSFLLFHSLFPEECDVRDLEKKYIIDIHEHPNATFANEGLSLFKSHFPFHPAAPFVRATNKTIYLLRDPIDVMMSAFDFGNLIQGAKRGVESPEFRDYVRGWLASGGNGFPQFGPWVNHVRSWLGQTQIPVHIVTYQNLVEAPERELPDILAFLGTAVPPERQRLAIERSSMKSMAAMEEQEVAKGADGIFFRGSLSTGYGMGHRFINKGHRNSYDTVLTAEERALADKVFGGEVGRYLRRST